MDTPARIPLLLHARIFARRLATAAHLGVVLLQAIEKTAFFHFNSCRETGVQKASWMRI